MLPTSISIKLKYKIQILYKMIKANPSEFLLYHPKTIQDEKPKQNSKIISQKNSMRNSIIENYKSLPGYDTIFINLSENEKEENLNYMSNINFKSLSLIFQILYSNDFYKKIKSNVGVEIIKNSLGEVRVKKINGNGDDECFLIIRDECEVYLFLKEVLNISEIDAINLYDLFKYNEYFAITESILIVIVYLFSASEEGMLSDFIKNFDEILFDFISGGEKIVSVSRLTELDKLIGLYKSPNYEAKRTLNYKSLFDLEKFREIYSELAADYDFVFKCNGDPLNLSDQKQNKKQNFQRKKDTI